MRELKSRNRVTIGKRGKVKYTIAAIVRDASLEAKPPVAVITTNLRSYNRGTKKGKTKRVPLSRLVRVRRPKRKTKGKGK